MSDNGEVAGIMGLFSKLFGDNQDVKAVFETAAKTVLEEAEKKLGSIGDDRVSAGQVSYARGADTDSVQESGPFGRSWGSRMPGEPNQFNYPGTFDRYFDQLFRTEFPEYEITSEGARYYNGLIFTFRKAGRTALIVELLPQRCAAVKLRRDCEQAGIPYLRYYYDHEGWWNTYSYVTNRTRNALGG